MKQVSLYDLIQLSLSNSLQDASGLQDLATLNEFIKDALERNQAINAHREDEGLVPNEPSIVPQSLYPEI